VFSCGYDDHDDNNDDNNSNKKSKLMLMSRTIAVLESANLGPSVFSIFY